MARSKPLILESVRRMAGRELEEVKEKTEKKKEKEKNGERERGKGEGVMM